MQDEKEPTTPEPSGDEPDTGTATKKTEETRTDKVTREETVERKD